MDRSGIGAWEVTTSTDSRFSPLLLFSYSVTMTKTLLAHHVSLYENVAENIVLV
jgi:hypothetical protein